MSKRIPQLDGLRAVAILAVFLRHAVDMRMMWMGVDIFFILSGFLITGILLDQPKDSFKSFISTFYARRGRRILPPYFLLLIVASLLFGTIWIKHWYLYFGLTNYFGYFYKDGTLQVFNALWSLGVEEQFYLFWPLVIFAFKPKKLPYVLLGMILAAPLLRGLATYWSDAQPWNASRWFIYKSTPFRMDCLAVGALITFLWRAHSDKIRKYGYLALIFTVLTPPVMIYLDKYSTGFSTVDGTIRGNVVTLEISLLAALGVFLWGLGGRYTWILTTPPMLFLGRISYSFYLIHQTMLLLADRYIHQTYAAVVIAFAGSTLYATLSWYWMEKPLLQGGNARTKTIEAAAAQHTQPAPETIATHSGS